MNSNVTSVSISDQIMLLRYLLVYIECIREAVGQGTILAAQMGSYIHSKLALPVTLEAIGWFGVSIKWALSMCHVITQPFHHSL